jgi:hypothetical protein
MLVGAAPAGACSRRLCRTTSPPTAPWRADPWSELAAKNAHVDPRQGRQTVVSVCRRSTQVEPPCQRLKGTSHQLRRILPQLPVKTGVVVRINATLECQGISGPIKEACRYAQCADLVTTSPCGADFVGLAFHVISLRELAMLYRSLISNSILLH